LQDRLSVEKHVSKVCPSLAGQLAGQAMAACRNMSDQEKQAINASDQDNSHSINARQRLQRLQDV
jgi:hypothetical protein